MSVSRWSPMRRLVVGELMHLAVALGWRVVATGADADAASQLRGFEDLMEVETLGGGGCLLDACVAPSSRVYELLQDAVDGLLAEPARWGDVARSLLVHATQPDSLFDSAERRANALVVLFALLQREAARAATSRVAPDARFVRCVLPHLDKAAAWCAVESGVDAQRRALRLLSALLSLPRAEADVEGTRHAIARCAFARAAVYAKNGFFADAAPATIKARAIENVLPHFLPGTGRGAPWRCEAHEAARVRHARRPDVYPAPGPAPRAAPGAPPLQCPAMRVGTNLPDTDEDAMEGTTRYAEYEAVMHSMLKVLVRSGSLAALDALALQLARADERTGESGLQPGIERMVSCMLCTVTIHVNHAHILTRSP
jgi:hypothetical protein